MQAKTAPIRLSGMAGADGKKVTQFVDPETGEVKYSLDEYIGPDKPAAPRGLVEMNNVIDPKTGLPSTMLYDPDKGAPAYSVSEFQKPDKPTASASAKTPEELALLDKKAAMILENPDLLKEYNPKDSAEILDHIARGGPQITNLQTAKAEKLRQEAIQALTQLKNMPGKSGMIGAPSVFEPASLARLVGMSPPAGSVGASFQNQLNRVKSTLTLPRLQIMRGTGPLSNKDLSVLERSATSLGNRQSEVEFNAEIDRLLNELGAGQGGGNAGNAGNAGGAGGAKAYTGEVRKAADGRILGRTDAGAIVELVKSGNGWVVK